MKPILGVQLYTLREYIKTPEDFDLTLSRLREMGVDCVQISAIGDFSAQTQKKILDKHNISVCVTHKPFDKIVEDIDTQIQEHKIIECDAIGLGCPPTQYRGDSKSVRSFISKINEIAPKLKQAGMTFNYHNHAFEFYKLDDMNCCMMDLLLEETDEEVFHFIPDCAWMEYAGVKPTKYLERMKGRIKVIHFKDYIFNEKRERKFVSLGKGYVKFEECYKTALDLQIPYIMYEQDLDWTDGDAFKATEESLEYMRGL